MTLETLTIISNAVFIGGGIAFLGGCIYLGRCYYQLKKLEQSYQTSLEAARSYKLLHMKAAERYEEAALEYKRKVVNKAFDSNKLNHSKKEGGA